MTTRAWAASVAAGLCFACSPEEPGSYGVAVDSSALAAAGYSARVVSIVGAPTAAPPGSRHLVTLTLENDGAIAWGTNEHLVSRTLPRSLWGFSNQRMPGIVAPGAQVVLDFPIEVPATAAGPTRFALTMHHSDPDRDLQGAFAASGPTQDGDQIPLVDLMIDVDPAAVPPFDAEVVSAVFGGPYAAGETVTFTVEMRNTGSQAWTGQEYSLRNTTHPDWLRILTRLGPAETVAPGATRVFTFTAVAPATGGDHLTAWRMAFANGVGYFGETAQSAVTVTGGAATTQPLTVSLTGANATAEWTAGGAVQSASCEAPQCVIDVAEGASVTVRSPAPSAAYELQTSGADCTASTASEAICTITVSAPAAMSISWTLRPEQTLTVTAQNADLTVQRFSTSSGGNVSSMCFAGQVCVYSANTGSTATVSGWRRTSTATPIFTGDGTCSYNPPIATCTAVMDGPRNIGVAWAF